jgi:hypothetical protein
MREKDSNKKESNNKRRRRGAKVTFIEERQPRVSGGSR